MRRRAFLSHGLTALATLAAGASSSCARPPASSGGGQLTLRDRLSGLDVSHPTSIAQPATVDELADVVRRHDAVCAAGMRHSSGGQPLLDGGCVVDTTRIAAVGPLQDGVLRVRAGATWADVGRFLRERASTWSIRQKQTIDAVTLGGSLAANAHGNGIGMPPLGSDVVWLEWLDGQGVTRRALPESEAFRAAVGGFGLTGLVTTLGLQLQPRTALRAFADEVRVEEVAEAFARRAGEGARYASAMLCGDASSPDFLRRGYLVSHVPDFEGLVERTAPFSPRRWVEGMSLLHGAPARAWREMCAAWVGDAGRTWAFDDVLAGGYVDDYHARVDGDRGVDLVQEAIVPHEALPRFVAGARAVGSARILLCEVRSVGADTVALLRYVPRPSLAVALTVHLDRARLGPAAADLRRLLDLAIDLGGGFHPAFSWAATPAQLSQALDGLDQWRSARARLDPDGRFHSDFERTRMVAPAAPALGRGARGVSPTRRA